MWVDCRGPRFEPVPIPVGHAQENTVEIQPSWAKTDGDGVKYVFEAYDWDTIAAYTQRTNRVVIAHEDQLTGGFGGEIAARIGQELFHQLDAPVTRVAAKDCPVAYAPVLEEVILPGSGDVLRAIRSVAAY